jgi:hypothetical protein
MSHACVALAAHVAAYVASLYHVPASYKGINHKRYFLKLKNISKFFHNEISYTCFLPSGGESLEEPFL